MQHILSLVTALTLSLTLPAAAQSPMSGAEFDDYATGKTLYFGLGEQSYGVEEYLPDQRVRWSFLDGECKEGTWYEDAGQICFVYENEPTPQCWSFFKDGSGLRAVFENDPGATTLYEARQNEEPMMCYGPEVGV
ncbi:hypothetical protein [Puniceibacterium sediminis]|uniref:Uncharacterized protein n=1 Tax=Puniceibacterium sediminis TaxID=1608407 RepID=A0A238UVH1_9RHOB|nr:hypothetical protein [Puniceibacterium sediminis]SNR26225.1 hypothetical protein SAMN06265370_101206 [Puniceibacterium sediminis]